MSETEDRAEIESWRRIAAREKRMRLERAERIAAAEAVLDKWEPHKRGPVPVLIRELRAALTHPAPTSTGAGTERVAPEGAARGEGERG